MQSKGRFCAFIPSSIAYFALYFLTYGAGMLLFPLLWGVPADRAKTASFPSAGRPPG